MMRKATTLDFSVKSFTLIEMVMVLVIVGVLAALAVPKMEGFYAMKLSGAVKKVVSDIRYVQRLALTEHTNCRVVFNALSETYAAEKEYPNASNKWVRITDPFTNAGLLINYKTDPQYSGIDIISSNFGGTSTLLFNWQGIPQSSGSVSLSYRGNNNILTVENNTGRVGVQ
jgi:prepilin-type N-terminal cleavage/methylation domain-containing protein